MPGGPAIKLADDGIPITNAPNGPALTPVDDPLPGAGPFCLVLNGGAHVTLLNADGTPWTDEEGDTTGEPFFGWLFLFTKAA